MSLLRTVQYNTVKLAVIRNGVGVVMKDWRRTLVSPSLTIRETIQLIDDSSMQIALIIDQHYRLLGIVTDGDVRRGILKGISLDDSVGKIMNTTPVTTGIEEKYSNILAIMKEKQIRHIPIIDKNGSVIGIKTLENLLSKQQQKNWVVIMAGGLGLRLRPLTNEYPKPLLKVGNKPILETMINNLIEHGFSRFYISVNYKAEMIEKYFGDGSNIGADIRYIYEDKKMGTAGALSLLNEKPYEPILVLNGDVLTKLNFQQLLYFHNKNKTAATICIRQYDFQVPYGVIKVNKNTLQDIEEKPIQRFFVNAGIYVLNPLILDLIPKNTYYDMTTLLKTLISDKHKISVFPIREYWLDIGKMDDFNKANGEYHKIFNSDKNS